MKKILIAVLVLGLSFSGFANTVNNIVEELQNISVTISTDSGQGSGVIVTRNSCTYVITAAHCVSQLRHVRRVINQDGSTRYLVNFDTVTVLKDVYEKDEMVGTTTLEADVVKFSDADFGQDIAVLKVRKTGLPPISTRFYLENALVPVGTKLFHMGSMMGHIGSNSFTTGVLSQIGRTINGKNFYQSSVVACGGSSGCGLFLEDGRYIGMLVMGVPKVTGFNLFTPMNRIKDWAKSANVMWLFDEKLPVTDLKDIELVEEQSPIVNDAN